MKFRYSRWDGTQRLDDLDAGDVLDALSDERLSMWAKLKVLVAVWWPRGGSE